MAGKHWGWVESGAEKHSNPCGTPGSKIFSWQVVKRLKVTFKPKRLVLIAAKPIRKSRTRDTWIHFSPPPYIVAQCKSRWVHSEQPAVASGYRKVAPGKHRKHIACPFQPMGGGVLRQKWPGLKGDPHLWGTPSVFHSLGDRSFWKTQLRPLVSNKHSFLKTAFFYTNAKQRKNNPSSTMNNQNNKGILNEN